jgi:hypothetical protein
MQQYFPIFPVLDGAAVVVAERAVGHGGGEKYDTEVRDRPTEKAQTECTR